MEMILAVETPVDPTIYPSYQQFFLMVENKNIVLALFAIIA